MIEVTNMHPDVPEYLTNIGKGTSHVIKMKDIYYGRVKQESAFVLQKLPN